MNLIKFFKTLINNLVLVEKKIDKPNFVCSQMEMDGILKTAKHENLKFIKKLSSISCLSAVEIEFLLAKTNLNEEKIKIIKKAAALYKEEDFAQAGQTFSDFIFKVGMNIDILSCANIGLFKDLAQCRNEIYDFKNAMRTPHRHRKKTANKMKFAFEKIHIEK